MPLSLSSKTIFPLLLLSCTAKGANEDPQGIGQPEESRGATIDARVSSPLVSDARNSVGTDPQALVDIQSVDKDILLDIRYASTNNLVGRAVYRNGRCLLRAPVAQALARVQSRLTKQGVRLLVWDCYRPFAVQEEFWKLLPDARYVAKPIRRNGKPWRGSKHNRGAAIDVSLADATGIPLTMPTDHDDFSEKAGRDAAGIPKAAADNAKTLDAVMQSEGFEGIASEWWHYDYRGWQDYALSEQEL